MSRVGLGTESVEEKRIRLDETAHERRDGTRQGTGRHTDGGEHCWTAKKTDRFRPAERYRATRDSKSRV